MYAFCQTTFTGSYLDLNVNVHLIIQIKFFATENFRYSSFFPVIDSVQRSCH